MRYTYNGSRKSNRYVQILREKFANSIGLPLQELLPETMIEQALEDEGIQYRKRLYDPIVTLWTFLCQVLDSDKSCRKAVSRVLTFLATELAIEDGKLPSDEELPSNDTGAYCKARQRLKESLILRLLRYIGQRLHQRPEAERLWRNRRVFLVDGSTLSMADTEENQAEYPQHTNQSAGCGFPISRIVAVFCLATGAVMEAITGSLAQQELPLFRGLYDQLKSGDVALGDRAFGAFADIFLLSQRGVDCVFRMHGSRKTDFRKGKRLGRYDHIIHWKKPRPSDIALAPELYALLPDELMLREVRFLHEIKGYRTQVVTLVTTLLDYEIYTKQDLAELYGLRWQVEIDLRHLKTTMQMEHLRSKTPEMVRKEFYVHLLAYNLLRTVMWDAGIKHHVPPLRISLKGTIQHLCNFTPMLAAMPEYRDFLYAIMLMIVSHERVPDRPFRVEPRLLKKRPKHYRYLQQPRHKLRQQLTA